MLFAGIKKAVYPWQKVFCAVVSVQYYCGAISFGQGVYMLRTGYNAQYGSLLAIVRKAFACVKGGTTV